MKRAADNLLRRRHLLDGAGDTTVPVECAHAIAVAYGGEPETLLIDGAGHTFDCANPFDGPSPALEELIAAVTAFLGGILA